MYVGAFALFCIASGLAFAPLQLSPSPCIDEPAAQENAKNFAAGIAGFAVGFLGTPVCWIVGFALSTVFRARRPVRTNAAVRAQVLGMIFEVFAVIFAVAAAYVASKFI